MSKSTISRRALLAGVAAFAPTAAAALPSLPLADVLAVAVPPLGDHGEALAVLARAEQAIDLLRTRYVCAGWTIDEAAATRALDYFRRMGADPSDDDPEEQAAIEFVYDHGQSLDWIIGGDPGGMICGAAARSARAAVPFDPIFALIEKHLQLQAETIALADAQNALEESLPDDVTREPRVAMYPERDGKVTEYERTADYTILRHDEGPVLPGKFYYASSMADLKKSATSIPKEHRDAWLADREAALKRDQRALRRRQRKAGLPQITKRAEAAYDAEYLAARKLLSTAPTTPAGVAALMSYCINCSKTTVSVWSDSKDTCILLGSIATAMEKFSRVA